MSEPLIFIDTARIKEGKAEEFRKACQGVVELLEANPVRHLYFALCIDDDGTQYTNLQIHPDSDSMVEHLRLVADHLEASADLLDFTDFEGRVLGSPGEALMAHLAPWGPQVDRPIGGFTRLASTGEWTAPDRPLVFVNTYSIRDGAADDYRAALPDWFAWLEAEHPRMLHFNAYLAEDGAHATTVQVHPDSRSMEFQLKLIAGKAHEAWQSLIDWSTFRITVIGRLDDDLLAAMRQVSGPDASMKTLVPTVGFSRLP